MATVVGLGVSLAMVVVPVSRAAADTSPPSGTPSTVSADSLPTWQVNGVVWAQVVVGNTAYVTGSFTQARPPGVAVGGAGSIQANNIFAYDVTTGNPVSGFSHQLNAQGLSIAASPDGSRVYVGGDFTTVDGAARNHLAAFNTASGALVAAFAPSIDSSVRAIAPTNSTVYVGGSFSKLNGTPRKNLAAASAATGATVTAWAPEASGQVNSMILTPDSTKVVVGGRFATLNSAAASGMGAVDSSTGALLPWAANQVITDGGSNACGILSLSTDGTHVFASGFAFGCGNFEGTVEMNPSDGSIVLVNDCHGDTYSTFVTNKVLYTASHAHDCSAMGGFPQTDAKWSVNMRHALAFTVDPQGVNRGPDNYGWNYNDVPASKLLQWYPTLAVGSFTGQSQAAWSVSGNSKYVVLGGEFPTVNGTAQQGLTRFAVSGTAPNKVGPKKVTTTAAPNPAIVAPSATSLRPGSIRVGWQAAVDQDNATLTYNVYRSGTTAPVYTTTQDSNFWTYPSMGFVDKGLAAGKSYTYTIKATDPFGNVLTVGTVTGTVSNGALSAYENDVLQDGATSYWRLGESSGTTVYDHAGFNDATASAGVTRGADGAIAKDSDGASVFDGSSNGQVLSPAMATTSDFSTEAWVRTTSTTGGKIIGYGDSSTGSSSNYDRHVYMDNAGHIVFGVYPGGVRTVTSPKTYNDGRYHHIVAEQSATNGIALYVDGKKVGSDAGATTAQTYAGYWHIGGDNLSGWPNQPSSSFLAGTIDDVAVYPTALSREQILQHYGDAGGSTSTAVPTDTYGKAVLSDEPDLYWRLGESDGSTAVDASGNDDDGVYAGGVTLGQPGGVTGTADTAAGFDGSDGTVGSSNTASNPTTYSEELWFKTTTTHGGKLIGFGDRQSGNSGNYDRHVYMENSGRLVFGVWTGQTNTITSPSPYNDGAWHHMVASQGADGMRLYVDGAVVGTNPQTQAQAYSGYWRVGGDSSWGGDSSYFAGTIDEVAVYSSALDAATVQAHYKAGGGSVANTPPTASFAADTSTGMKVSFDATGSSDSDGTVASYDWDFGDGKSGSGVRPTHTFATPGSHTVKLTVTDDGGAKSSVSQDVSVTDLAPRASFTHQEKLLTTSVDASESSDPDGSVGSYAWSWGDGTSDGSGRTASHTYDKSGTYTVKLTVTDDQGVSDTVSHDVTVTANVAPVASFTSSTSSLTASVDGSASSDADGSVASYAWSWGDGTSDGSGRTASHTFDKSGTYTVKLTVTDNDGATGSTTRDVTVAAPTFLASDAFGRAVANGWGSADVGGSWLVTGTKSVYSVDSGRGLFTMSAAGTGSSAQLNGVSSANADVRVSFALTPQQTGGGTYVYVIGRRVAGVGDYRAKIQVRADNSVWIAISRFDGGTEVQAIPLAKVAGLTYAPGKKLDVRFEAVGKSPTTLQAKVWPTGDPEPSTWQAQATDSTGAMQTAGAVSLAAYLTGNSTALPVTVAFRDLKVSDASTETQAQAGLQPANRAAAQAQPLVKP